ncbi:MAG: [NiFe]-hydrogenase assembly chaperone HybE [Burkholderiales bacterium]
MLLKQESKWTSPAARIEPVFLAIQKDRMDGLPILNPALSVEAVGFVPWREDWVGVLISPWFMNLMLMPGKEHSLAGDSVVHSFPSGDYAFSVGYEAGLGYYQSCSLFSPVFEFSDQASARSTAEAVMKNVFAPPPHAHDPLPTLSRRAFLAGGFLRGRHGGD